MGSQEEAAGTQGEGGTFDPDKDRYPHFEEVLNAALGHEDFPTGDIERIELFMYASGEGSFRVWEARSETPLVGAYTNSG